MNGQRSGRARAALAAAASLQLVAAAPAAPPSAAPPSAAPPSAAPASAAPASSGPGRTAAAAPAPSTGKPASPGVPTAPTAKVEATGVLGREVQDKNGQNVGRIINVLVDRQGRPRAAVIDFGGFMGVGSRKVAVDWSDLTFPKLRSPDPIHLLLSLPQIEAAPEYDRPGEPAAVVGGKAATAMPAPSAPAPGASTAGAHAPAPAASASGAPAPQPASKPPAAPDTHAATP